MVGFLIALGVCLKFLLLLPLVFLLGCGGDDSGSSSDAATVNYLITDETTPEEIHDSWGPPDDTFMDSDLLYRTLWWVYESGTPGCLETFRCAIAFNLFYVGKTADMPDNAVAVVNVKEHLIDFRNWTGESETILPKPSPSEGTPEIRVDLNGKTIVINTTTNVSNMSSYCEEGKICRGMTLEEVEAILGQPDGIDTSFYGADLHWQWTEDPGQPNICAPSPYTTISATCALFFTTYKDDYKTAKVLTGMRDINIQHIDATNY